MLHSVFKLRPVQYIYVKVMSLLSEISIKYGCKVVDPFEFSLTKRIRYYREGIGYAIFAVSYVRYLCNGVE